MPRYNYYCENCDEYYELQHSMMERLEECAECCSSAFRRVLSICCNLFLIWFSWKSLSQISEYDEELRELITIIKNFSTHVESVYEMEMFYGDETLRHLMRHGKDIVATFSTYDLLLSDGEQDDQNYDES